MSKIITVLVFVIIPLGVIALVAALIFSGSDRSRATRRYRPGRRYDFQPIWFLASPDQVIPAPRATATHEAPALAGPVLEDMSGARVRPGPTGGASDSW